MNTEKLAYIAVGFLLHRYIYRPLKAFIIISLVLGAFVGGVVINKYIPEIQIVQEEK